MLDASAFAAPKTSEAADLLDDWGQSFPTLVVLSIEERNAALSFRNLAGVAVLTHENVGIADLVGAASLVCSQTALDALSARAGGASTANEDRVPAANASEPKAAKPSKQTTTAAPTIAATADEAAGVDEAAADGEAES